MLGSWIVVHFSWAMDRWQSSHTLSVVHRHSCCIDPGQRLAPKGRAVPPKMVIHILNNKCERSDVFWKGRLHTQVAFVLKTLSVLFGSWSSGHRILFKCCNLFCHFRDYHGSCASDIVTRPLSCSWHWSMTIAENVLLVLCTTIFPPRNSARMFGWFTSKLIISRIWTDNHRGLLGLV